MTPEERIQVLNYAAMIDFACWTHENRYMYLGGDKKDRWYHGITLKQFTHEEIIEKYFKSIGK